MTAEQMTARQVLGALWWHFTPRWAMLTEVTARAQYSRPDGPPPERADAFPAWRPQLVQGERRIDALLLRGAKVTGGIERIAVEVKVTRADFRSDVARPEKQAPWRELAHRHAYAVPEGLVGEGEVPAMSGLLVIKPSRYSPSGYTVRWARQAKKPAGHDPGPLPLANVMDGFWRAGRAEAQIKGYGPGTQKLDDDAETLRAEVLRLRKDAELAANRLAREVEQKQRWQHAFGALGQPTCSTCGELLHLARPGRRGYGSSPAWEHREPIDQAGCDLLRRAAAITANNELPEGRRMDEAYLWIPGAEPADLVSSQGGERP